MSTPHRLSEADENFVVIGAATGAHIAPLAVTVYEKPYQDLNAADHLNEVMARLLPPMRQRLVHDRFSTAPHRWQDVPGFELSDQAVVLPAPGDGTLRAVLDWAQEWGRLELPLDRPPWRSASFEGVTVDGVPGRLVVVSQFHHALIDGQGAARLAESFYQWGPDGPLPEMPPPVAPETSTPWQAWRSGWAAERAKAGGLARNTARRLKWAASNPEAGLARARELGAAVQRLNSSQGTTTLSPLLRRTSERYRFDHLRTDLGALRAGARSVGGSANDGLMGAVSLGMQRYHLDHGLKVPAVRTLMAISTRTEEHGHEGNQVIGAIFGLPLIDDAGRAVKSCQAISREQRDDADLLWLLDHARGLGNRVPKSVARWLFRGAAGLDMSVSNVKGMPLRNWIGGVEALETIPLVVGGPAVSITLVSGPSYATIGLVTCPEAITDPEHLVERLAEALAEVCALAG